MEAQEIRSFAVEIAVRMGVLAQDLVKVASEIETYIRGTEDVREKGNTKVRK